MDTITFMVTVFCLIDDWLKDQSLYQRGPAPMLNDSEVLTIEIMGEFLGIDTDKGLYLHFRRHYSDWFPGLRQITRTTYVRQAANLWTVKYHLRQVVLDRIYVTVLSFLTSIFWVILKDFHIDILYFSRYYLVKRLAKRLTRTP